MELKENIAVWQQNVNKLQTCQHNLISNNDLVSKGVSIIALQEPAMDANGYTLASRDWTLIYPTPHQKMDSRTRAITFIRATIKTNSWKQLDFPSPDVTVVQLKGE